MDDAIVVIENTYRHQQEYGEHPIVAAKAAAGEVFVPVLTSTVTTLSAFLPLTFWPGIVGSFMKFFPYYAHYHIECVAVCCVCH